MNTPKQSTSCQDSTNNCSSTFFLFGWKIKYFWFEKPNRTQSKQKLNSRFGLTAAFYILHAVFVSNWLQPTKKNGRIWHLSFWSGSFFAFLDLDQTSHHILFSFFLCSYPMIEIQMMTNCASGLMATTTKMR